MNTSTETEQSTIPVVWVTREEALTVVKRAIVEVPVVLDIGPGIHPQDMVEPCVHICVEPHPPYTERLRETVGGDPRFVFLNATWENALRLLPDNSVDTVFALDVIEHLEKADGLELLREAERVARRQIVIFTPLGFNPQSYEDDDRPDRWGMDGGNWQTHRSGWLPEEFGDEWRLICCKAFHLVDEHDRPLEEPCGAIWAIKNIELPPGTKRRALTVQDRRMIRAWFRHVLRESLPESVYRSLCSTARAVRGCWRRARQLLPF